MISSNELSESEMIELKNKTLAKKSDLYSKMDQLSKLESKYVFKPSTVELEIGWIENEKWVSIIKKF